MVRGSMQDLQVDEYRRDFFPKKRRTYYNENPHIKSDGLKYEYESTFFTHLNCLELSNTMLSLSGLSVSVVEHPACAGAGAG